ncbi:hypothetical protein FWH58_03885 [Candidatus Saccharibacteria bacterium]|nr:hypothetical protein [Candidatus Saccharibacteria bacterium]
MNQLYNEISLEKHVQAAFGLHVDIKSIIADKIPAGASTGASVFLSEKGLLYALIVTHGGQNLGDVKKILTRMNLRAEQLMPPHADAGYFDRIATAKFREIFPGRAPKNDNDLVFYRTLAPYNPALVQIAEIAGGVIQQYDSDAVGHWRPSVKFTYRRITTS